MSCDGFQLIGRYSLSNAVKKIASVIKSISRIVCFLFPVSLFAYVAKIRNYYACSEPVKKLE